MRKICCIFVEIKIEIMDYTKLSNKQLHELHYDLTKEIWENNLRGLVCMEDYSLCCYLQELYKYRLKNGLD